MSDARTADDARPNPAGRRASLWRPAALIAALLALAITVHLLDLGGRVEAVRAWVAARGAWAPAAYILVRAGAALLLIPGSVITVVAAVLFPLPLAILYVSVGKTISAALGFLIARYFARDAVAAWLERRGGLWQKLDELVTAHGSAVIALMRLIPIVPPNVQNYAFGLVRVRFGAYLLLSWLCTLIWDTIWIAAATILAEFEASRQLDVTATVLFAAANLLALSLAAAVLWRLWPAWKELAALRRGPSSSS